MLHYIIPEDAAHVTGETYFREGASVFAAVFLDFTLTANRKDEAFCTAPAVAFISGNGITEPVPFFVRFSLCSFSDQIFWEPAWQESEGLLVCGYPVVDPYECRDVYDVDLSFEVETAIASACEKAEEAARNFLRSVLDGNRAAA